MEISNIFTYSDHGDSRIQMAQNTVLGGKLGRFASKEDFFAQEGGKLRKTVLSNLSEKNFPLVSAFLND